MIRPSGECFVIVSKYLTLKKGYYSCTQGKGKQKIKTELGKRNFREMTCKESLVYIAKMLHLCHDESED